MASYRITTTAEELLLDSIERGNETFATGRYICTYKENALEEGARELTSRGLKVADARDSADQAVDMASYGDADALVFPEIGAALISGEAFQERGLELGVESASDSPFATIEPEVFVFSEGAAADYLRGFRRAAEVIASDLSELPASGSEADLEPPEADVAVLGATWGLAACKASVSARTGRGISVAILDTGLDLRHPDFAGRSIVTRSFVGQPVQDLHSHGTHCTGTACGTKAPPGATPRYGIGYGTKIYIGKVLSNSGSSVSGSVLDGMNWAIANRCTVISLSLGGGGGPYAYYTAAGAAALKKGCLIVAAAGNNAGPTLAPANSPTIMSVASLDNTLRPSSFSNFGKVEIAAPGRDVFSSVPMPTRYGLKSGTSMATPHVAGCAALWAQTNVNLRGMALWKKLQATSRPLPFPPSRVGSGLVQAP